MKRFFLFLLALGLLQVSGAQPIPDDPDIRVGRLDNGMTFYLCHNEMPAGRAEFYIAHHVGALQEEEVLLNYGYVSGEACVIDNKKPALNAIYDDWGNNKEYQRFIEDQRLAENEGLVETSAVTAFLEEYYKEHPIDNSYEGILARRSGLTKDQVIATLDTMEFIAWQAGYDPSDYAPYVPEVQEEEHVALEETEDYGNLAIIPHLFFEEKRQKNFAV